MLGFKSNVVVNRMEICQTSNIKKSNNNFRGCSETSRLKEGEGGLRWPQIESRLLFGVTLGGGDLT